MMNQQPRAELNMQGFRYDDDTSMYDGMIWIGFLIYIRPQNVVEYYYRHDRKRAVHLVMLPIY
jgi:hypothetical protein